MELAAKKDTNTDEDEGAVSQNPVSVNRRDTFIADRVGHPVITVVKDAAQRKMGTKM